jgi:diguanylate cyclase (GGDEF)-like protein
MPSTDALLFVVLLAVLINLVLATVLVFMPRLRAALAARRAGGEAIARPSTPPTGRFSVGVFGPFAAVQAPTDTETGFDLPVTWSRWLDDEDARIRRYRRSATVVFVEIEGLDRLIERLGDDATARLVPPVAQNLRKHARETDRFARLAVGRFGVLMLETDEVQAINYVERVRSACDTWLAAGGIASRLLIGWAEANTSRSIEAAVLQADERLNTDRRLHAVISGDDELPEGFRASA